LLFQKASPPLKILTYPADKVTMTRISITFSESTRYLNSIESYRFANIGMTN
jgi:hypothetical protein